MANTNKVSEDSKIVFASSYSRMNGQPIDDTLVWYPAYVDTKWKVVTSTTTGAVLKTGLERAQHYATTATAYVGQVLTVMTNSGTEAAPSYSSKVYVINDAAGNLVEVSGKSFSTIAVSGQNNVVADVVADTLTLAGSNVSITTDANTDKVTFSVADGTTGQKGIVQLSSTAGTAENVAATPNGVQAAINALDVTAPTVPTSGTTTATAFIDSVSQTNGKITATKKNLPDGTTSQKGIVQLNDAVNSTSTTQAATANAVKKAYDKANHSHPYLPLNGGGTVIASSNIDTAIYSQSNKQESGAYIGFKDNTSTTLGYFGVSKLNKPLFYHQKDSILATAEDTYKAYYTAMQDMYDIWGDNNGKIHIWPEGTTSIPERAEDKNAELIVALFPDSVTSIGGYAFQNCSKLKRFIMPAAVNYIGPWATSGCASINEVYYLGDLKSWCNVENCSNTFNNYSSVYPKFYIDGNLVSGTVNIPQGVTQLTRGTFRSYAYITGVTIPNSVTYIGDSAFSWCKNLASVTLGNNVQTIADGAFCGSGLTSVVIPDSVNRIGKNAFQSCNNLTNLKLGKSLVTIDNVAFSNCHTLPEVVIPDSVTYIGGMAFYACYELKKVTIGSGVTQIGKAAFDSCHADLSITFKDTSDWYFTGDVDEWNNKSGGTKTNNPEYYAKDYDWYLYKL